MKGATRERAGRAAEAQVAARYEAEGYRVLERRWRCEAGEIDLILEGEGHVVFCEVKASLAHARAAERLAPRQMARIALAASCYLDGLPRGSLTPARFDVALVDRTGRVEILEGAFGA